LSSTRNQMLSAEDKAARLETVKAAREERLLQAEAVARAGQAATALFTTAFGTPQQPVLGDAKDDVVVNAVSGTVSVLGTERQHELIRQHIEGITQSVQRQVLIEATIVEVTLSDAYQGGIDWSRLAVSGGIAFNQRLLGGFDAAAQLAGASAGNAVTVGYQNPTSGVGNISATVKLLQEFGNTRVLSSPKLMALNNQTALLKVVDNVVYFEIHAQTNTTQGVATTTFNSTPKIVAVGVVMGVTPQVANDKRVSLTVRPTISRVLRFKEDPNPSLTVNGQRIPNPVPEIQVREMESVLQVASGQTVILGGLMQDDMRFIREQLPVLGDARDIGELFRFRNERVAKTELVIFLKPTVITNPTLDIDELRFFQRFLPDTLGEPASTGGIR
jgi:MSHA type pilus biogenesis protein MshL